VTDRPALTAPLSTVRPQNYGSVSESGSGAGLAMAAGVAGGAALASSARGNRDVQTGQTPGGGNYVAVEGPRGEFGAIRGPGGGTAAGARGPGGEEIAGVRGPRGNWIVDRTPDGCHDINWGGHEYWCDDYYWYAPVWYDDDWYWEYRYPPVGYWYEDLPVNCETVTVSNVTYYVSDSMYFEAGAKEGKNGYVVAPPPATNSAGQALAVLQRTCDFLGSVTSFTAQVDVTIDRYLESGDKVPTSSRRTIRVQQPDHAAADVVGAKENQRMVYNGKTWTAIDRLNAKHFSIGTLPRLEDALPDLRQKRKVNMPFGDLLQRDAFDTLSIGVKSAEYVGVQDLNGTPCHHVAFTQDKVDWELWVKTGDQPLPMKLVASYKTAPKTPRFTWICAKWEINQPQPPGAFAVELPIAQKPPSSG
jgi:hypothetical protein